MVPKKKEVNPDAERDELFGSLLQEAQKHYGKEDVYVAAEHERHIWGIELAPFPMRWLFGLNIVPLQRMIQFAGEPKSCKSACTFFMARLFHACGGFTIFIEAEAKSSYSMMMSITGKEATEKRMMYKQAHSIEEWQEALRFFTDYMKKKDPKGKFPVLFIVDSMTGVDTAETEREIEKTGHAKGRTFSDLPNMIARYLRSQNTTLVGRPYLWLFTNHLKEAPNSMGRPIKKTVGGKAPGFHESYELWFSRISDIYRGGLHGHQIAISVSRSSMGPAIVGRGKRSLAVEFLWCNVKDPETGKKRQVSWWDWDDSLAKMLVTDWKKKAGFDISDIINVKCASNRYWTDHPQIISEAERIYPKAFEDEKLLGWQIGRLVHSNPEMLIALEDAFEIQQYEIRWPALTDAVDRPPWAAKAEASIQAEDGSDQHEPEQEEWE